jgi:hypothetical protein
MWKAVLSKVQNPNNNTQAVIPVIGRDLRFITNRYDKNVTSTIVRLSLKLWENPQAQLAGAISAIQIQAATPRYGRRKE